MSVNMNGMASPVSPRPFEGAISPPSTDEKVHAADTMEFKRPPDPPGGGNVVPVNGSFVPEVGMITPDKKVVTPTRNEVRKRPFQSPPNGHYGRDPVSSKKIQVAKCLFNDPDPCPTTNEDVARNILLGGSRVGASRCLFGPPAGQENHKIFEEIEEKRQQEFETFSKRYVIESVLGLNY